jgi:hypothetical protein
MARVGARHAAPVFAFDLSAPVVRVTFSYLPCPGGGMADAEDLKSSGDFSSCGFDSHPGHQFHSKQNTWIAFASSFPRRPDGSQRTLELKFPVGSLVRSLLGMLMLLSNVRRSCDELLARRLCNWRPAAHVRGPLAFAVRADADALPKNPLEMFLHIGL